MTRQTTAPIVPYRANITARTAREIARRPDLLTDPPYQRASVWDTTQRLGLIESWMRGLPVPAIIINERDTTLWDDPADHRAALVDGRQRIETARLWFTSELAVPASWFPPIDAVQTEDTPDGPYIRYTGLSTRQQRLCANRFLLPITEVRLASVREEAALYLLLNSSGTAHTAADLDRARRVAEGK